MFHPCSCGTSILSEQIIQLQITVCGIHSGTCCNPSTWKVEAQRTEHLRPTWATYYTVAQVGLKLQTLLSQASTWRHYMSGFMKTGPEGGKKDKIGMTSYKQVFWL